MSHGLQTSSPSTDLLFDGSAQPLRPLKPAHESSDKTDPVCKNFVSFYLEIHCGILHKGSRMDPQRAKMSPESTIPRALASRIDHYALHEPGKTYMSVTRQTEAMHFHVRDVTYQEFARAINQACWWLDRALGDGHETFEAFTYFGPPDLRWTILFVAGIKTRRQVSIGHLTLRTCCGVAH